MTRSGSFLAMAAMAGATMLTGTGSWHAAIEVPGTSTPISASIASVSCVTPGNCSAGGDYVDRSHHLQAMVVTETAGTWGRAIEVPGTAALNVGGFALVAAVSCATPGNCAANGEYTGPGVGVTAIAAFVVDEVNGKWGRAHALPGIVGVNDRGALSPNSLFCSAPGNCVTGGMFSNAKGHRRAYVAEEVNGHWGQLVQLSGAGIAVSGFAEVDGVTCFALGDCTATGVVQGNSYQLFAVTEQNGTWGQAVVIPESAALSQVGAGPGLDSMACASPGNCAVGGSYQYFVQDTVFAQPFVVAETDGQWGQIKDVPGLTRPSNGGSGAVISVSCAAPGTCAAGGTYPGPAGNPHAFVVSETGGQWGKAVTVSGAAGLTGGQFTDVNAVSCTAPGVCAAGGDYSSQPGGQAFVVSEAGGQWGKAQAVPGLATLNVGKSATVNSMSCNSAGHCTAAGTYLDHAGHQRAFVASES